MLLRHFGLNPASLTPEKRDELRLALLGASRGWRKEPALLCGGAAYVREHYREGKPPQYVLAYFFGKACRVHKNLHLAFGSHELRAAHIEETRARIFAHDQRKKAEALARKAPHGIEVGQIMVSSWGYDQTNVDFYEVIAVRGAVIDLQPIKSEKHYTGDMTGKATPKRGEPAGDVLKSKRPRRGYVRLTSYSSAGLWDGRPMSFTEYA